MKYRIKQKTFLNSDEKIISNIFYIQKKMLFLWVRVSTRVIPNDNKVHTTFKKSYLTFNSYENCESHYKEFFECENVITFRNKKIFKVYDIYFDCSRYFVMFGGIWVTFSTPQEANRAIKKDNDKKVKSTKITILNL